MPRKCAIIYATPVRANVEMYRAAGSVEAVPHLGKRIVVETINVLRPVG
jgi:hypothetical protein